MTCLPKLIGVALALALLSFTLEACATCEASGSNGGQAGRCGLFGQF